MPVRASAPQQRLQVRHHLLRGGALCGVGAQAVLDQGVHCGGGVRGKEGGEGMRRGRARRLHALRARQAPAAAPEAAAPTRWRRLLGAQRAIVPAPRRLAGGNLPYDDPQAPDVGGIGAALAQQLLGRGPDQAANRACEKEHRARFGSAGVLQGRPRTTASEPRAPGQWLAGRRSARTGFGEAGARGGQDLGEAHVRDLGLAALRQQNLRGPRGARAQEAGS